MHCAFSPQQAAAHAQRLGGPAARDLASLWHSQGRSGGNVSSCQAAGGTGASASHLPDSNGVPPYGSEAGGAGAADSAGNSSSSSSTVGAAHTTAQQGSDATTSAAAASSSASRSPAQQQQQRQQSRQEQDRQNLPRRKRGNKLSNKDIYGGQYQLRSNTDWVEPWVTQTIPEERLPRWEGTKFFHVGHAYPSQS